MGRVMNFLKGFGLNQDQQQGAYNILNDSPALQDTSPKETALTLHDFDRGSDENGGDCAGWNRI